jgi:phospholipase/carboxylesterase
MEEATMLADFQHRFVPGKLPFTVLLLHGTGGDENDLLPVGRGLAPGAAFLSPRGKVLEHGSPRFFSRIAPGVFDEKEIQQRAAELAGWIGDAVKHYEVDSSHVYALGYSNGANIATAVMLLHPGVLAGAALLRPMLAIRPDPLPQLHGAPVLISAGQEDPTVHVSDIEKLADLLTSAGARVDVAIQNAGHDLTPADFSLGKQWFATLMS